MTIYDFMGTFAFGYVLRSIVDSWVHRIRFRRLVRKVWLDKIREDSEKRTQDGSR